MDSIRDRVGSLGTTKLRLAKWRDAPYQRSYQSVLAASSEVPGSEGKVATDPNLRYWHMDDWSGGEGEDLWRPGLNAYSMSANVRPSTRNRGLILGANQGWTTKSVGGTFNDASMPLGIAVAQGTVWALGTNVAYQWDVDNSVWKPSISVTLGSAVWSMSHGSGAWIYVGTYNEKVIRFKADATNETHFAAWGSVPALAYFDGNLYGLHYNDLYIIDQTTADTRTLVADPTATATDFIAKTPVTGYSNVQRLVASDVGVVWFNPTDDGVTTLYEYNAFTDAHGIIGTLPRWAWPDDILFHAGFVFVAFRMPQYQTIGGQRVALPLGSAAADTGAFIYYQRGAQRGVLGPIRSVTDKGYAVTIAGVLGDDLVLRYDGAYWAYNLSSGGIYQLADSLADDTAGAAFLRAVTFGADTFGQGDTGTSDYAVERIQSAKYTTEDATLDSGRYDFGWLGTDKVLLDVTVIADVPTNTTVRLAYRVEAGSFTTHADTMDDTETSHTFTISTGSASVVGRDFEVRLIPDSSSSTKTPTIRSVTARATTALKQTLWTLEVDVGTPAGARDGDATDTPSILAALDAAAASNQMFTFTDPWHRSEFGTNETFDVTVVDVTLPDGGGEGPQYARLTLRSPATDETVVIPLG